MLVKLAISGGADIDKPNKRVGSRTALHSAATRDYPNVIRTGRARCCDFRMIDWTGTPLHLVAWRGSVHATRALLALGADIMRPYGLGNTPAHCSATRGHGVRSLSLFMSAGFDPRTREKGQTILHTATEWDNIISVDYLLQQNVVGYP